MMMMITLLMKTADMMMMITRVPRTFLFCVSVSAFIISQVLSPCLLLHEKMWQYRFLMSLPPVHHVENICKSLRKHLIPPWHSIGPILLGLSSQKIDQHGRHNKTFKAAQIISSSPAMYGPICHVLSSRMLLKDKISINSISSNLEKCKKI